MQYSLEIIFGSGAMLDPGTAFRQKRHFLAKSFIGKSRKRIAVSLTVPVTQISVV